VREIAERTAAAVGKPYLLPEVTGKYRVGDIRHCVGRRVKRARAAWVRAAVSFDAGLEELAGWLERADAAERVDAASAELAARGLTV
jgi:dTDP-L-rhamnose 4-epimerase